MINYFFLELYRRRADLSCKEISALCGKGEASRTYYSRSLRNQSELPAEYVKRIADELDISPDWITQSPAVFTKAALDGYIDAAGRNGGVPLVVKTKQPNQFVIVHRGAAQDLIDFKDQCFRGEYCDMVEAMRHVFRHDPDYKKMPLRPVVNYALQHYGDIPAFVKALALRYPNVINETKLNSLMRKLEMAAYVPELQLERKVLNCFVEYANTTRTWATCDFMLSSVESVFNLFISTYISLSPWVLYEDSKTGDYLLTLTDPRYLPSAEEPSPGYPTGPEILNLSI